MKPGSTLVTHLSPCFSGPVYPIFVESVKPGSSLASHDSPTCDRPDFAASAMQFSLIPFYCVEPGSAVATLRLRCLVEPGFSAKAYEIF